MISNTQYKTHTKPFDYREATTEFFTPEVYEKLTNILYSDTIKDWKVYNDDGSDPAYPQGQVIMINDEAREKATGFLREFYDWLWTDELTAHILKTTGVEFNRYSCLWHLDYPGFDQGPHNDVDAYPNIEVTTFQVYMAQDNTHIDSGVLLLDNSEIVKAHVPYKPNHAWVFTATDSSWHAVEEIDFYRPSFMVRNFKELI
jgi:hypothetical protein